jgi:hypothetical protein
MQPKPPLPYTSYLLRIWCSMDVEPHTWRAYLENLATGKRIGFASLDALFTFLELVGFEPEPKMSEPH